MATRSQIGKLLPSGKVSWIYCHNDGYPSGVGKTLRAHYGTEKKVNELLQLGAISSLGPSVGEKVDFDDADAEVRRRQCIAYHRDRGEEKLGPNTAGDVESYGRVGEEYNYVYVSGSGWKLADKDGNLKSYRTR